MGNKKSVGKKRERRERKKEELARGEGREKQEIQLNQTKPDFRKIILLHYNYSTGREEKWEEDEK